MVANLFVAIVVFVIHFVIIKYLWLHRHRCATCPVRSQMLNEIRAALK